MGRIQGLFLESIIATVSDLPDLCVIAPTRTSTITSKLPEKMSTAAPVEVGTRGTVGSLLKKELEYFRRLELDRCESSIKPERQSVDMASSGGNPWPSFGFLTVSWRRKKRRGSAFLPRVCSAVEVAESYQMNGISKFSYRNLKADVKNCEI
ncbi:unnamed protein product [Ilex paraguariensis]|uniref:Uncharacterized protein n=1 Tax=Ilex paraguariensis TaxID=185542 RepID=A0ABC8RPD3_9AQUA